MLKMNKKYILKNIEREDAFPSGLFRRLGAKGSYLTLVRVADRILFRFGNGSVFCVKF